MNTIIKIKYSKYYKRVEKFTTVKNNNNGHTITTNGHLYCDKPTVTAGLTTVIRTKFVVLSFDSRLFSRSYQDTII